LSATSFIFLAPSASLAQLCGPLHACCCLFCCKLHIRGVTVDMDFTLHKFSDKNPGTKRVTAPELADSTVDLQVPEKMPPKKTSEIPANAPEPEIKKLFPPGYKFPLSLLNERSACPSIAPVFAIEQDQMPEKRMGESRRRYG
jgi:hypothetical protein